MKAVKSLSLVAMSLAAFAATVACTERPSAQSQNKSIEAKPRKNGPAIFTGTWYLTPHSSKGYVCLTNEEDGKVTAWVDAPSKLSDVERFVQAKKDAALHEVLTGAAKLPVQLVLATAVIPEFVVGAMTGKNADSKAAQWLESNPGFLAFETLENSKELRAVLKSGALEKDSDLAQVADNTISLLVETFQHTADTKSEMSCK